MILDFVAFLSTALFFGASMYVSFVEHPARLSCNVTAALDQWRPSYRKAAAMQIMLSVIGIISSVVVYFISKDLFVLIAGLLLATIVPWTLIIIMPINKQLLNTTRNASTPGTLNLLQKWGKLHHMRTVISLAALAFQIIHISSLVS